MAPAAVTCTCAAVALAALASAPAAARGVPAVALDDTQRACDGGDAAACRLFVARLHGDPPYGPLVNELVLRGVAAVGNRRVALAETEDGKGVRLEAGDRLYNGVVVAVDADTVMIRADVSDPAAPARSRDVRLRMYREGEPALAPLIVAGEQAHAWAGAPIVSARFRDAPIGMLLEFLCGIAGIEGRVPPDLEGTQTFDVRSEPWDWVLADVLDRNGLGADADGTTVVFRKPGQAEPARLAADLAGLLAAAEIQPRDDADARRLERQTDLVADAGVRRQRHERLLAWRKQRWGADHPEVVRTLATLAALRDAAGDRSGRRALEREADRARRSWGRDTYRRERTLLDARLRTLSKMLPERPDADAGAARLRALVDAVLGPGGLLDLSVEAPRTEGSNAYVPVRFEGRVTDVNALASAIVEEIRLTQIESLELEPAPDAGRLLVKCRVRLHYADAVESEIAEADWEKARATLPSASPAELEAFVRGRRRLDDLVAHHLWLRASGLGAAYQLVDILSEKGVDVRWDRAGFEIGAAGTRVNLQGAFAWPTELSNVRDWLNDHLEIGAVETRQVGVCTRFEVTAPTRWRPAHGSDHEVASAFGVDERQCHVNRDPGPTRVVRARGTGSLTLRLRDVDAADVILLLHRQTGQAFVIDGDVSGRLDVDLRNMTLEEALVSLRDVGLRTSPLGRLRRVGTEQRGEPPAPPTAPGQGYPLTLDFKHAALEDVVQLLRDIVDVPVLAPPLPGRISIVAEERPWDELYAAILASAGLSWSHEEGKIVIHGEGERPLPKPRATSFRYRPVIESLKLEEFDFAGVFSSKDGWVAVGHEPRGHLHYFPKGQRLFDAEVLDVGPEDVLVGGKDSGGQFRAVRFNLPLDEPPPITLSRETTRIVAPLTKTGLPDYAAHLNARHREGVTPENNAWVLLEQAPAKLVAWDDAAVFEEFAAAEAAAGRERPAQGALSDQRARALKGPWKEADCPLIAEWLRRNEPALALVAEAARRPRYWRPLPEGDLASVLSMSPVPYRHAANALVARAFLRLQSGEAGRAADDLLSAIRLGSLVGHGDTVIDALIGRDVRDIAAGAIPAVAARLDGATARELLAELRRVPPARRLAETIDDGERYLKLASVLAARQTGIARGPGAWKSWIGPLGSDRGASPFYAMPVTAYDWDELLRLVNRWSDMEVAVFAATTPMQRARAEADAARVGEGLSQSLEVLERRRAGIDSEEARNLLLHERHPDRELRQALAGLLFVGGDLAQLRLWVQVALDEGAARLRLAEALVARVADRPVAVARLVGSGAQDGYAFALRSLADGEAITAVPETKGETGVRWFCVDSRGGSVAANEGEPLLDANGCVDPAVVKARAEARELIEKARGIVPRLEAVFHEDTIAEVEVQRTLGVLPGYPYLNDVDRELQSWAAGSAVRISLESGDTDSKEAHQETHATVHLRGAPDMIEALLAKQPETTRLVRLGERRQADGGVDCDAVIPWAPLSAPGAGRDSRQSLLQSCERLRRDLPVEGRADLDAACDGLYEMRNLIKRLDERAERLRTLEARRALIEKLR